MWRVLLVTAVLGQTSFPITIDNTIERPIYDLVVVGGGLAGLSAANEVLEAMPNASVLLIEARGQVGGRIRATSIATVEGDRWVDIGSQFVSRDDRKILNLAQKLGISFLPQAMCGQRHIFNDDLVRRRKRSINWSNSLSIRPSFDQVANSPDAETLSQQTVGEFIQNSNLSRGDADTMNRLLQTLYDSPEGTVSALQVAITAASQMSTVNEQLLNYGHGHSLIAEEGIYELTRKLADGVDIKYSERVIGINKVSANTVVQTDKASYDAKQVVVALPPSVAADVAFAPALELPFQDFLRSYTPTGRAFYFTIVYANAFWRSNANSGQVIYTSSKSPVSWLTTFDVTPSSDCLSSAGVSGVLWGIAHLRSGSLNQQARHRNYIEIIAKALHTTNVPLDVKDMQFSSDPLARGSIGVLPPNSSVSALRFLSDTYSHAESVHFASAELSSESTGLMEGAVSSGVKAATRALNYIKAEKEDQNLLNSNLFRQFDSPVPEDKQTAFVYSTSTHYPPTKPIQTVQEPANLVRSDFSGTPFIYSTSTQYPPSVMERIDEPANSIKTNDLAVEQFKPQADERGFAYETSSQYPSTTTGMQTKTPFYHFSNGNTQTNSQKLNDRKEDVAVISAETIDNYGIASDDSRNLVKKYGKDFGDKKTADTSSAEVAGTSDNTEYSMQMSLTNTSSDLTNDVMANTTEYSSVNTVVTNSPTHAQVSTQSGTTYNAVNDEEVQWDDGFQSTASKNHSDISNEKSHSKQSREGEDENTDTFVYRTSSINPNIEPIQTTTISHFSMNNVEEGPAALILPAQTASNVESSTFKYSTTSVYPKVESMKTETLEHFSNGNTENSAPSTQGNDLTRLHETPLRSSANAPKSSTQQRLMASPPAEVVRELQKISQQAPSETNLTLATQLSSLVQRLLSAIQRLRR